MFDIDAFERSVKRETKRVVKQMRMFNELERLLFDFDNETLTPFGAQMHTLLTAKGQPNWVPEYLKFSKAQCDKAAGLTKE